MCSPILLAASLALLCAAGPAAAADWSPLSREQALAQSRSQQADEKRLAYARLAEVGTMEDVPVLLAGLWDEESSIRGMAEQAVWGIWMRTDDSVVDPMFQTGIQLIIQDEFEQALGKFDEVIALKPQFAEAWNRRGDTFTLMGDYDRALSEYARALELNPYHFGSMESAGQIWLERSDYRKAAGYFQRALEINPNLSGVAEVLRELEQRLERDRI